MCCQCETNGLLDCKQYKPDFSRVKTFVLFFCWEFFRLAAGQRAAMPATAPGARQAVRMRALCCSQCTRTGSPMRQLLLLPCPAFCTRTVTSSPVSIRAT